MKHSTTRLTEAASVRAGLPIIILLIVLVIGLSACTLRKGERHRSFKSIVNAPFTSYQDQEDGLLKELISCIESQDKRALTKYFAPRIAASDSFDQQCSDLFDFYNGTMESYAWKGASAHETTFPYDYKETKVSYDIFTTETSYRLSVLYCNKDDEDDRNIGIHSLYIIRFEDTDPKFSYWGDGNWTPGINVMTEPQA